MGTPGHTFTQAQPGKSTHPVWAHVIFDNPVIPPNTGNAIRMCAGTGAHLHLVRPLGFDLDDRHMRRAGLDYHDLATVVVHDSWEDCLAAIPDARVFCFTGRASTLLYEVEFRPGDALVFGNENTGIPEEHMAHPRVTERVRIPMLEGRRSMNLSNSAAVATYEAWRQLGCPQGIYNGGL
ncbi:MAG: tRNA (cytidine(34)-2'-O)-methyltransferase [Corynebacterium sp.]|nr:tRNA (cytidine(34)-2'-O)-methyltransferase [Corynebacterium sp.]